MWDATIGYNLLERCAGVKQSYLAFWAHTIFQGKWSLTTAASFFGWLVLGASLIGFGCVKALRARESCKWLLSEQDMGADGLVRICHVCGYRVFVYQNANSK